MTDDELKLLRMKLKQGDYDGMDIMSAWVVTDELLTLRKRTKELEDALGKIARWIGEFPETGDFWDDGTPVSYGVAFGSNGERDYMRKVAIDALKKSNT